MATIKFFIQSSNDPAGIYIRLREGVQIDAKAKTKFAINRNDWSKKKGQPINLKDEEFKALNNELSKLNADLLSHYNKRVNKEPINSQWLKDFINPPAKPDAIPSTLVEHFTYYGLQKKNTMKKASQTKLNVVKHLVEGFQAETKRKYFISDVDENFKQAFIQYCLNNKYAQNTIARTFRFIKTICYHAESNNIEVSPKLKKMIVQNQVIDKIYLNLGELKKIEKAKLEHEYLINAKDWLLISCETGQRVSDFLKFKKSQIRHEKIKRKNTGENTSVPLIEFTQVKTGKIMTVPLSEKVMEILKKRKGNFPRQISSQRYNEYIKDVCKLAGLTTETKGGVLNPETNRKEIGVYPKWQLVSSHIGRRSFATNNYGIIPTSLLISATGHSTEKQFLEYIGKTDSQKALQLAEYF